jgi:transmembrane sensor
MSSQRILELMARKMGRAATEAELEELERLLAETPSYRFLEATVHSLHTNEEHIEPATHQQEIATGGWEQLAGQLNAAPPEIQPLRSKRRWLWAAAVLILLGASGAWWLIGSKRAANPTVEPYAIYARFGTTLKARLPDGTLVWLNAGSRLSYTDDFMQDTRTVLLQGEAFFDVAPDGAHPFIVDAGSMLLKVLGTSFNVKAYPDEPSMEATLLSGKLQVQLNHDPEKELILQPLEKLTMTNPRKAELKYQVQSLVMPNRDSSQIVETAWIKQRLAFTNESFEQVALKMERRYNVHIHFEYAPLKQEILSGVFEKESVGQALQLLQMTTRFHFRIKGDDIYLYR